MHKIPFNRRDTWDLIVIPAIDFFSETGMQCWEQFDFMFLQYDENIKLSLQMGKDEI